MLAILDFFASAVLIGLNVAVPAPRCNSRTC